MKDTKSNNIMTNQPNHAMTRALLLCLIFLVFCQTTVAFTAPLRITAQLTMMQSSRRLSSALTESPRNDDKEPSPDDNNDLQDDSLLSSVLSRFTSPRLDDPFLPLSDALVAQIIAPTLQIAWLAALHAPAPSWLRPIFPKSQLFAAGAGSLLAPTLIHGAALATCWLVGALAARAYQGPAIAVDPVTRGYGTVVSRVVQAGCFATGILILATQFDLYTHYGYVQWGDSPETDFRLRVAVVEGMNDVFFEAITLLSWRLYLAYQSSKRI